MKLPVTAIFDIGKTNKKFFLFDAHHTEVHQEYCTFPETTDDDGYPCDDLPAITAWMRQTLNRFLASEAYDIQHLNFSTYGASFVHLDAAGRPLTPLYNYIKPFPEHLARTFYASVGGRETFCTATASPALGMLNSGLQIYWLKHTKPEIFAQVRHSLHFPQYCSYLFSGQLASDYTSVGCHTGLWDYAAGRYHAWVQHQGVAAVLAPLVAGGQARVVEMAGRPVRVGTGLHDSSAALVPYMQQHDEPFLLLSTGTWNITLNPFNTDPLTPAELGQDCLQYLQPNGRPVKAARLFMGSEYNYQTQRLAAHFGTSPDAYQQVAFDKSLYHRWQQPDKRLFAWKNMQFPDGSLVSAQATDLAAFDTHEAALHRLMIELIEVQVQSVRLAAGAGAGAVRRIFVDGGFANSSVFLETLRLCLPGYQVQATPTPLGSSLGAALALA